MNHAGEAQPTGFPVDVVTLTGSATWGRVIPAPNRRKLAIVGSHPATRELAPYDDPDFEIWLFNEAAQKPEVYRRWDALFQLHLEEVYSSQQNWVNQNHWTWLQLDHGPDKTIYMQERDERVPNSARYPLEEVLSLVPYKYLRSTPAQALALAILLGYEHVALYGSELTSNTEYTYQAVNYAFWIGFGLGRGVTVDLQCWHNEFYNQPVYGYEGELQLDKSYFEGRIREHEIGQHAKEVARVKLQNKLDDAFYAGDYARVGEFSLHIETLLMSLGEATAALNEAKRYAERTNPISRQEFERVSAQAQIDGETAQRDMHHEGGKAEYVWNAWRQTGMLEAKNQLREFLRSKNEKALETGRLLGVFKENMNYMAEYDRVTIAAGGKRAVIQAGVERQADES